jgi:hypothetical protein
MSLKGIGKDAIRGTLTNELPAFQGDPVFVTDDGTTYIPSSGSMLCLYPISIGEYVKCDRDWVLNYINTHIGVESAWRFSLSWHSPRLGK